MMLTEMFFIFEYTYDMSIRRFPLRFENILEEKIRASDWSVLMQYWEFKHQARWSGSPPLIIFFMWSRDPVCMFVISMYKSVDL